MKLFANQICHAERSPESQRRTESKHVADGLRISVFLAALLGILLPLPSFAQPVFFMDVCWLGFACMDLNTFGINLTNTLFGSAALICAAIFLIGTAFMIFSAGNDTLLQKGKGMMTGSLIALAIIVGAYGIWRTVVFIIYSG